MISKLYALKDVKVGFKAPFICTNNAIAIRQLKNVLGEKNEISMNPEDFELWFIGEYDEETGIITTRLEHVFNVVDLVEHD